jgi:hypothetical protein
MAVRVKLADGTEILVEASLAEFERALRAATETAAVLKIEQPDGRTLAITPQTIETMQEEPEEAAALTQRLGHLAGAR